MVVDVVDEARGEVELEEEVTVCVTAFNFFVSVAVAGLGYLNVKGEDGFDGAAFHRRGYLDDPGNCGHCGGGVGGVGFIGSNYDGAWGGDGSVMRGDCGGLLHLTGL